MMMTSKDILEQALRDMADSEAFTMDSVFTYNLKNDKGYDSCKTPGCIAGHIIAAAPSKMRFKWDGESHESLAARIANITEEVQCELFVPDGDNCSYSWSAHLGDPRHITREHAVACLRKFIDTGVVDWDGTAPKGGSNE